MPYGGTSGRFGTRYQNPQYSPGGGGSPIQTGGFWGATQPRQPANANNVIGPSVTYLNQSGGPGGAGPSMPGQQYSTSDQHWQLVNDPRLGNGVRKYFNSATGETYYDYDAPALNFKDQGRNAGPDDGAFWWLRNLESALGEDDNNQVDPVLAQFKAWEGGGYNGPDAWVAPDVGIPDAGVDTRAIVEARRHYLDENMSGRMSDAARKMGAAGMLKSSDYVDELGEAERNRDRDLAALFYDYDFQAAQADANRRATARERMLDRDLSAWGTRGGWLHSGEMGDLDRDFQAWAAENEFNLANAGIQNEFNLANWQNQSGDRRERLAALLPLLLAGGGGAIQNWGAWL